MESYPFSETAPTPVVSPPKRNGEKPVSALTAPQQRQVVELLPLAEKLAEKYSVYHDQEEALGIAQLALCEAVAGYDPSKGADHDVDLERYVRLKIVGALKNWCKKEIREREAGLFGGDPTARQISYTTHAAKRLDHLTGINGEAAGRKVCEGLGDWPRVRRSSHEAQMNGDEAQGGSKRNFAANVGIEDPMPEERLLWVELTEQLPEDLQAIALSKWLEKKTEAEIAREFGISQPTVCRRLQAAKMYATAYLGRDLNGKEVAHAA